MAVQGNHVERLGMAAALPRNGCGPRGATVEEKMDEVGRPAPQILYCGRFGGMG